MRLFLALIMMIIFLGSSKASESAAPAEPAGHGEEAAPEGGPLAGSGIIGVELPALLAPVTVNGELQYYEYILVRVELNSDSQKQLVLEKVPYLCDAFLREVHRASIALNNDPDVIDTQGLMARLSAEATKVLGPDVVKGITFKNMVRRSS